MSDPHTFPCPHCGEPVPSNAKACPHCGSDEGTGWSPHTYLDGIDLPDDEGYDEILSREFGGKRDAPPQPRWIIITGIVVLLVFVAGYLTIVHCAAGG